MGQPSWPSAVVAIAFVALVGVMFWKAVDSGDFATVWAGVGTIVGVLVGAIPSYFFKAQADKAQAQRDKAQDQVTAISSQAGPDQIQAAVDKFPAAFK